MWQLSRTSRLLVSNQSTSAVDGQAQEEDFVRNSREFDLFSPFCSNNTFSSVAQPESLFRLVGSFKENDKAGLWWWISPYFTRCIRSAYSSSTMSIQLCPIVVWILIVFPKHGLSHDR